MMLLTCRFRIHMSHAPRALAPFSVARHSPPEPQCPKPQPCIMTPAAPSAALAAMVGLLACAVEASPSCACSISSSTAPAEHCEQCSCTCITMSAHSATPPALIAASQTAPPASPTPPVPPPPPSLPPHHQQVLALSRQLPCHLPPPPSRHACAVTRARCAVTRAVTQRSRGQLFGNNDGGEDSAVWGVACDGGVGERAETLLRHSRQRPHLRHPCPSACPDSRLGLWGLGVRFGCFGVGVSGFRLRVGVQH